MKYAVVCAAVLAVATAAPTTSWTLDELSTAVEHPGTPAKYRPYLEKAFNKLMLDIFNSQHYFMEPITISTPDGLLSVEDAAPIAGIPAKPNRDPVAVVPETPEAAAVVPEIPETPEAAAVVPEVPETPEAALVIPDVPKTPEAAVVVPEVSETPQAVVIPEVPGTNPIDGNAVAAPDANSMDLLQPTPAASGAGQGILNDC